MKQLQWHNQLGTSSEQCNKTGLTSSALVMDQEYSLLMSSELINHESNNKNISKNWFSNLGKWECKTIDTAKVSELVLVCDSLASKMVISKFQTSVQVHTRQDDPTESQLK